MNRIDELTLGKLRQEEDLGFLRLVEAQTVKCTDEKVVPLHVEFAAAVEAFDQSLKTGGPSAGTKAVTEMDSRRDWAYNGLSGQVKSMLYHFNADKAENARLANIILKRYGNPTALPYIQENGVLVNVIQDFNSQLTSEQRASIGIEDWLTELSEANTAFIAAFEGRGNEQITVVTGASKAARTAADNAYRALVNRINALAEVNGEADYLTLILALNNLIDYQKSVLAARKTNNAKKNEQAL